MDTQAVASMIATLGLPAALLLLIMYGTWKGMGWLADKVILPVANEAVSLLRSLRENIEVLTTQIKQIGGDVAEVRESQEAMRTSQDRIERHLIPNASSVMITPKEPPK